VIYGAGGAIGSAVARAFAHEGAKLFITGHKRAPVEALAREIISVGGSAQAAEVNALDEHAVDQHLQSVIDEAGRLDISFNAIGVGATKLGVPLLELDVEQFSLPIAAYTRSYFLTARQAAVTGWTDGSDHDRQLRHPVEPPGARLKSRTSYRQRSAGRTARRPVRAEAHPALSLRRRLH